ncbi:MAG: hypothetical protein IAE97_01475 [Chthoniobacterales bacterium]|nr:hypothetical protein [Chthoniobacterales bacterium]
MNNEIHKLLRLKRHEHPTPDYFERFLDEFRERQRAELLQQPTLTLLWERIVNAFPNFHVPRLAYAGVGVAAVILSTVILVSQQGGETGRSSFALNDPTPTVNVLPTGEGNIRMPVSSRSDFPPHYVLEARPVSYESPYSF